jgi:hypothetical protein
VLMELGELDEDLLAAEEDLWGEGMELTQKIGTLSAIA